MFKLPIISKTPVKENKFLTMDINSDCVKVLCFYKEDGSLKIIGSGRSELEPGLVRNGIIIDSEAVRASAESAVTSALEDVEDDVSNVIFGVNSDIVIENVTTAKITRAENTPITNKEIQEFENRIQDAAYMQVQTRYAETTGNSEENFQLITTSIVYTKIDEQQVDSLEGKTGKTVELAKYTAHCPNFYIDTLKKFTKKLGLNILAVCSYNYALLEGLKETEYESNDLIVMYAGTDFTSIGVVFAGAVVANKSLHLGIKQFTDELSKFMGLTREESAKIMNTYAKGELSTSESVMIQEHLEELMDIWLGGVEILFGDISGVKTFPQHIYLIGESIKLSEIEETLNNNPWTKAIAFKEPPTVQVMQFSDLARITDATGEVISQDWIAPAALAYIYEEVI